MVGLIDHENHITTQWFKGEGDAIILVGSVAGVGDPRQRKPSQSNAAGINDPGYNLGGSQYLKVCHGLKIGPPPHVDLPHEIKIQSAVRDLIREGLVKSAHDCSEGGLAVALAECCFNPEKLFGAKMALNADDTSATTVLFNESQSRIVISVAPENVDNTISMLRERNVPFQQPGEVGGDQLRIQVNGEEFIWPIADLYDDWWNSIRRLVESDSSAERIPSL
jgi:phosphoribosylformylglycinamidine synthase